MNSRVMILLALLLVFGAGLAGYFGYKTTQEAKEAAEKAAEVAEDAKEKAGLSVPGKEAVVIIKRDVPLYKKLESDDLTIDHLKTAPPLSFKTIDEVIGQPVHSELKAGSILEKGDLQPGGEIARLLRRGERAVAIDIDSNGVVGGGGFLQPGDFVDVLLFLKSNREPNAPDVAQVILQSIRVVGFGTDVISVEGGVAESDQNDRSKRARPRTAVLAVTERDAPRLMLASSLGKLRLAIRPTEEAIAYAQSNERQLGESVAMETAVPKTPLILTDADFRPKAPKPPKPAAGKPRAAAPVEDTVVIYRGLQAEKVKQ